VRLATLDTLDKRSRDGGLVVVDATGRFYTPADTVTPCLQAALDDWPRAEPLLRALAKRLDGGEAPAIPLDLDRVLAPLPRAYEWIDGSAYLNHVRLVRRARGAEPPEGLETDPLVYQGGSGVLLGPRAPLHPPVPSAGLDFEGEIVAVLGDVPCGTRADRAAPYVRLLTLANDVTYRNLVPDELKKGFGFFVSKPATAFAPFVVTPDELGEQFRDGRLHARLVCTHNGAVVGDLETGPEMHFSFFDLVAHVTRTRSLTAGTLLGSGTVSNHDAARGVSCLVERRTREILATGAAATPYLKSGDTLRLEVLSGPVAAGGSARSLFGAIEQTVA
jgi:fumarylacetoacetate (FAA) hydrolase